VFFSLAHFLPRSFLLGSATLLHILPRCQRLLISLDFAVPSTRATDDPYRLCYMTDITPRQIIWLLFPPHNGMIVTTPRGNDD